MKMKTYLKREILTGNVAEGVPHDRKHLSGKVLPSVSPRRPTAVLRGDQATAHTSRRMGPHCQVTSFAGMRDPRLKRSVECVQGQTLCKELLRGHV